MLQAKKTRIQNSRARIGKAHAPGEKLLGLRDPNFITDLKQIDQSHIVAKQLCRNG